MKPGAENQVSFSEIRIQDGVLKYEDAANHVAEQLGDIDLSLAWPSISRSFAATGQFDWRGERVDGSISASDFVAMLSGDRSGLKARIVSAPLKLAFDGSVANRTSLMMEGTVTVDSLSLRNAMRWMGQPVPGSGGFGRFALKARANLVGASVALTNVNVELDGNAAEGVMTFSNNGRQAMQATLAAGNLDFTPYISTVRLLASGARDWNRQLFDLTSLSATDLDMRLSAARVTVGPTKLGRTAFGANLRNGALALSIGEAQMYGGIAKGSFGIARSDAIADVKAQFQFTDVDLQACASELFGITKLSGRGNLGVSLTASGSSPFGLASSLDGNATLIGHDGAIAGFNVEQLLKRLERRPLSGGGNLRSGSTPYDTLTVSVSFNDGIATVEDVRVDGPTTRLTLTGTASVPTREYDLKGVASLTPAANGGDKGFELPFVVQGPWDDPLVFPDPESLIRRSPGAAPSARCGERPQDPRCGALGDRTVYRRWTATGGAGAGGRGEVELAFCPGRPCSPDERQRHPGLVSPAYRFAHAGYETCRPSRHVTGPPTPDAIRLVEKITPVTQRRLGVLVDRNDDRLHMRVAPAFPRRLDADLRQGF